MKNLFLLLIIYVGLSFTSTQTISIKEYIEQHGMPTVTNGILHLSKKNLTSLEGLHDISNLNLVTQLNLSFNKLKSLPDDSFNNLIQLLRLNLSHNQLQSLPDTIFDNLNQLRSLDLSNNRLQTLPDTIFANLNQLQGLALSGNQLHSLPDTIFANLNQLQELDLLGNQLHSLPDTIFYNLAQLKGLDLSYNQLRSLPAAIFYNLAQLKAISLSNNCLQSLPDTIFNHLGQLQGLDLSYTQLQLLPAIIFYSLAQLKALNLSNNRLQSLTGTIFSHAGQLQGLDLSYNQLQSLPATIFDNLAQLDKLNLSYNQLHTLFAKVFNNLTRLKVLYLCENQLQGTMQQFRQTYLGDRDTICLDFKGEDQEESEKVEQACFSKTVKLNVSNKKEKVALMQELKALQPEFLDIVLTIDSNGNTLLHKAVLLNNPLLVKQIARMWPQMLHATNKLGKTPLHIAATIKNQTIALWITKELLAASSKPEQMLQMQDNAGDTPLPVAIQSNNFRILQHLLAFENNKRTRQLGKSRKLNALLQQPDLAKAFETLARVREQAKASADLPHTPI